MKHLILTCLLFLFGLKAFGGPENLQFRSLSSDNGLSSSNVLVALQDYRGFIWLGTINGLNRYDGSQFVIYKNNPSDPTSIPNNYIRTLIEDHHKNLLIGTHGGLSLYNRDLDCFVNYGNDSTSVLYGSKFAVIDMVEDAAGNIWLGTNQGLIYFDRNHNKMVQYRYDPENPRSISHDRVECVYIDKKNRLWVSTMKGLNLFNPETEDFTRIMGRTADKKSYSDIFFMEITEDWDGNIWFGSTEGLFCLDHNANADHPELTCFSHHPADPKSLSNNRAKSLMVDNEGDLWIGTENGGINLFNRAQKEFIHYRIDEFNPMSLNNESIHSIIQDRSENLWFCTFGGGVNITAKNSAFIMHFKNLPGAPQSLSPNIVSCFFEDRYNRKFVGTDGGGFNLFNDTTYRFVRFNKSNSGLTSDAILCMAEGNDHNVWMGTWAGGLVAYNVLTGTIKSFSTANSPISDDNIYSIAKDKTGNLWLGTFDHGLVYYKVSDNKFITYSSENNDIANNRIVVVKKAADGQIYLGATDFFQVFNPAENRFTTYVNIPADSCSLSHNSVNDILIENDTCVWIATSDGLNCFNPKTGKFKRYNTKDGLPDHLVLGIAIDKSGILWLTTSKGLCRFDVQKNTFRTFTTADGLQSDVFFPRSIYSLTNGNILAGGKNGFNLISPQKYAENKKIPEIVLTDFLISNQPVSVGEPGSPLVKQISETREIILSYKQSSFTLFYTAMDYTNPAKNRYAHKLENFDEDWVYSGNKGEATYTNLRPGKYRLHVKGSNNDGLWNEAETTLEILIMPPWWRTRVAFAGYLLLILFFFWLFHSYRISRLEQQKALLEVLVGERTQELEKTNNQLKDSNATKDRFFSILAHDLRSSFNNILGLSQILNEDRSQLSDGEMKEIICHLHLSASVGYKLLEDILEWARIQTNHIQFKPQQVELGLLCKEVLEGLVSNTKNVNIKYVCDENLDIAVDVNMLKTVLRNLVSNAIKFSYPNGEVTITAGKNDQGVIVSVIDHGTGIKQANLQKLFDLSQPFSMPGTDQENGSGLGLIICQEFVKKHHGKIWVESEFGKGSRFSFSIPYSLV